MPLEAAERAADPLLHVVRYRGVAEADLHERVELPAELELLAALEARRQVLLEGFQRLSGERAVGIGEQLPERLIAAHGIDPFHAFTRPRRRAQSHSSRSRALRPRCSRAITVPGGQGRT